MEAAENIPAGELYRNARYHVIRRRWPDVIGYGPLVQLVILNNDGSTRRDWRDFQRIKNELVGVEAEGVELYPAESRLCDQANLFHLWVFPEGRFPFGFSVRTTDPLPPHLAIIPQRAWE